MPPSKLQIAEHLLFHTYPAINDPKLLINVLNHILDGLEDGLTESLQKARDNHEIPSYSDTLNGKLTAYKLHLAKKRGITNIDFMMITELQEILHEQRESPVEFRRKNTLVIADQEYQLRTVSPEKAKTYIRRAKALITRL